MLTKSLSPFVFGSRSGKRFGLFGGEVTLFHESWQVGEQKLVIEQQNSQDQHEVIQKSVIRRENDPYLPQRHDEKTQDAKSSRQQHHPSQPQFQGQRHKSGRRMEPVRKVLHVPSNPRRQRAVLVILVQRREVPPLRVAAHDLRHARFEIDAEAFPYQQEQARAQWPAFLAPPRPESSGRKE